MALQDISRSSDPDLEEGLGGGRVKGMVGSLGVIIPRAKSRECVFRRQTDYQRERVVRKRGGCERGEKESERGGR